jgi:DNA polymerase II small subunit/DNA polymerase delta subunit B
MANTMKMTINLDILFGTRCTPAEVREAVLEWLNDPENCISDKHRIHIAAQDIVDVEEEPTAFIHQPE